MVEELEKTVKESAQEFVDSGSQKREVLVYPDDISGLGQGKVVQVTFTVISLAKLENRPE